MPSAYGGRAFPVHMKSSGKHRFLTPVLLGCPSTSFGSSTHVGVPQAGNKNIISSREFEIPNFQDISLHHKGVKKYTNSTLVLVALLEVSQSSPMVLNHSLRGNVERKGRLWRQLFLSQDSAPPHHVAPSFCQRLKHFDCTFFTAPEAHAVPDEVVTTFMPPSPYLPMMGMII